MSTDKILVVDDDPKIRLMLRRCLESDSYVVFEAEDEASTHNILKSEDVQLITLDLQLGADSGLEIAKRIRQTSTVPIIIVTGQSDVIDRVVGLEVGADDYITKPFHVREVLARVRSVLRRSLQTDVAPSAEQAKTVGEGSVTFDSMTAHLDRFELLDRNGDMAEMTSGDFRMLTVFLQNPKRIMSRDRLMDLLKGTDWAPLDRTIDNQIARLRKKIERDPKSPLLIKTVRGIGYMFAEDVAVGKAK
ncbi:response regulator [Roseovarius arcticus]|uniref:response regulator n=1 Tax=Roseovarius arcticus TaxID=2547404 RepID=UPI001110D09F|nr:response regulator [Roseovarius arcticus]